MIRNNALEAKKFLTKNPQLAYALFQAMLMMNLVDQNVLMVVAHFIFKENG